MARPADLAGAYLGGVQTAGNIRQAQMRLEQQAAETQARLREEEKRVQEEHAIQQQRIQVAQAYNQQKAMLRKQQLDQVARVNAEKTATAARQFQAKQEWDKGLAAIDSNPDLTTEQKDAEKTRFIMRTAPGLGIPGTEAAAMIREMRPVKPTIPASVTDRGDFLQVTQPNGQVQLHPKPKAAKPGDPSVKVVLQEDMPPTAMPRSQAMQVIPGLPKELQTNSVNAAVMKSAAPTGDQSEYKSAADVKAAYSAGKISRAEAKKVLVEQFGLKE